MNRSNLLGVVFAAACFAMAGPAYANGSLDEARQTYFSDLTRAYQNSVKSLEVKNNKEGLVAIKELHGYTAELAKASPIISADAKGVATGLENAWAPVAAELLAFNAEVEKLEGQVGRTSYDISNLKTRYERVGSALEKFYEQMKVFKRDFDVIAGRSETAWEVYDDDLRDAFETMTDQLDDGNTESGESSAQKLSAIAEQVLNFTSKNEAEGKKLISVPIEKALYQPAGRAGALNVAVKQLLQKIETGGFEQHLKDAKTFFGELGAALDKSGDDLKDISDQFKEICETCK